MNVTEGSAKDWLKTGRKNNQSTSNPQLWDLRWFALLSGPLLFGTVILPLVTGPAIRYLCESYVTLRVYWRLGFSLLAIAYFFLFYLLDISLYLNIICDTTLVSFVSYQVLSAWRFKRGRCVWTLYAFLAPLVLILDVTPVFGFYFPIPVGFVCWMGVLLVSLITYRFERKVKRKADTRVS